MNLLIQPTSNQLYYLNVKAVRSGFVGTIFPSWPDKNVKIRDKWQRLIRHLDKAGKLTKHAASDLISACEERDAKKAREIIKNLLETKK